MKQRCTPQKSNRKMPKNGPYLKRVHLLKKKPSFWGLMVFVFGDVNGLEIVFFVESYIRVMIKTQKHWRIDTTNVYFSTLRQTNIAMENGPVEDVFSIGNGVFPLPC